MNIKRIQSRIRMAEEFCEIAILKEHMCCAYVQLDLLKEGDLNEICFRDDEGGQQICLRGSSDGKNSTDGAQISLNGDGIACIKKLISQCLLNPYDAEWLHCDIDLCSGSREDMTLCVRLK